MHGKQVKAVKTIEEKYREWCEKAKDDGVRAALFAMKDDEEAKNDAFYWDLSFGTGGLRGKIGAGTNRMNVYTVAKATKGLCDYLIKRFPPEKRRAAISFDSRIGSEEFSKVAAGVFAANGIKVFRYDVLMPTPCLSFAVRALGCAAGVMITASHNPAVYNGYKVYGEDGCQITTQAADEILAEIEKLDVFADVTVTAYDEGVQKGLIERVPDEVYTAFIESVKAQSKLYGEEIDRDVRIVYSPLNGTGLAPVLRALTESGFTNVTVVDEQAAPDGRFPTCPYPNPEIREAMALGIDYAKRLDADLFLATDPDCDRVGIAVRDGSGEYVLLTGNETGMLLFDYICARLRETGKMPVDPVLVKTVVTTDMAEKIAAHYGVRVINVLTGFKFIGEQIGLLEKQGKADSYVFGFEESYGYLAGTYVRDKDAVVAAFLICEMFAYYKKLGVSFAEKLEGLYKAYGYTLCTLHSFTFEGEQGMKVMQALMKRLRGVTAVGGRPVVRLDDYAAGLDGLPPADVLKFTLAGSSFVVRPSGTEPKIKVYITVSAAEKADAAREEQALAADVAALLKE